MKSLQDSVLALDDKEVRICLDHDPEVFIRDEVHHEVLHKALYSYTRVSALEAPGRRTLVYMLCNSGLDVNTQDKNGDTLLHIAAQRLRDLELCEALLQCGADLFLKNDVDLSPLDIIANTSSISEPLKQLFEKYNPGLWRAVAQDDLMSVRKLINLWCRVDIHKNGMSLKELALSKGTEHIIRLIKDINPSMQLGHSAMAGDVKKVESLCNSGLTLNLEFKNMGDMGSTPLFYAIMQNNISLVQLLFSKGANIGTSINFEDQEIPLYFTALNREVDPEIIKLITPAPSTQPNLLNMHYQGRNVLRYCVENKVSPSIIKHILKLGYPQLLAARNEHNLCARDIAEALNMTGYIPVIDEVVHEWYLDNSNEARKVLALLGYPHLALAQKDGVEAHEVILSMETSSEQSKFDSQLSQYQDHIQRLHKAVRSGDTSGVRNLLHFKSEYPGCFQVCMADSLARGDGQPLLHKAVLYRHPRIVELICQCYVKHVKQKVDTARDTLQRTALHYAYALPKGRNVVGILQEHGSSDFVMDKDGRSPLVFRDSRDNPDMSSLLTYHKKQNYSNPEPNVWLRVQRIPIVGCPHHHGLPGHHGNQKSRQNNTSTPRQMNPIPKNSLPALFDRSSKAISPPTVLSITQDSAAVIEEDSEENSEEDSDEDQTEEMSTGGNMCTIL